MGHAPIPDGLAPRNEFLLPSLEPAQRHAGAVQSDGPPLTIGEEDPVSGYEQA